MEHFTTGPRGYLTITPYRFRPTRASPSRSDIEHYDKGQSLGLAQKNDIGEHLKSL